MKKILLFGAGKSATVLIRYLLDHAETENWYLTVVDADLEMVRQKTGSAPRSKAIAFDINDAKQRAGYIKEHDLVISLLPPTLHILVAEECIQYSKNLLTASYVDEAMRSLQARIEKAGILFLCEMGLDPGIDHMSAKKLLDTIAAEGGQVTSFVSHCGGLVAPANDDNPWHYKVSWNPKNIVHAGKGGAVFRQEGETKYVEYKQLFSEKRFTEVPDHAVWCWYPNRDSLQYTTLYSLESCETFIRTTLRHPDFMYGWNNLLELGMTDDDKHYPTDGRTLAQVFKAYMDEKGLDGWLSRKMNDQMMVTKDLLKNLMNLNELQEEAKAEGIAATDDLLMVNDKGDLQEIDMDELKLNAAGTVTTRLHEANLTLKQLFYLGLDDDTTLVNRGECTIADILQFALEQKLALQPQDRDMIIMQHEIKYTKENNYYQLISSLVLEGEDHKNTAMAKTVGLPLGVAARLILNGSIKEKGLHIPIVPGIYEPVLQELEAHGIIFKETHQLSSDK